VKHKENNIIEMVNLLNTNWVHMSKTEIGAAISTIRDYNLDILDYDIANGVLVELVSF